MSILVRVLMLAACVPSLVLPPGVCPCRVGEWCGAPHEHRDAAAVGHCSDHHGGDASDLAATDTSPDSHDHTGGPVPHDDRDCPCCRTADAIRDARVGPTTDPAGVSVPALAPTGFVPAPAYPRPLPLAAVIRPSSPPLYLSHCSLVI